MDDGDHHDGDDHDGDHHDDHDGDDGDHDDDVVQGVGSEDGDLLDSLLPLSGKAAIQVDFHKLFSISLFVTRIFSPLLGLLRECLLHCLCNLGEGSNPGSQVPQPTCY